MYGHESTHNIYTIVNLALISLQNIPPNPEVPDFYPVNPYPPVPAYGYSGYPPGPPQIVVVQEPAVTTLQCPQAQVTAKLAIQWNLFTMDTLGTAKFFLISKVSLF